MMLESIEFTVGLHVSAYKDSRMSYITFVDFKHADDSIPPITYVYDIIKKSYSLYERGIMKLSTKEACDGLEPTSAWELDHVIDRLTGRVDWLAAMKRQEV
jgi:hypothetical protein